jgi:hypothetical protein
VARLSATGLVAAVSHCFFLQIHSWTQEETTRIERAVLNIAWSGSSIYPIRLIELEELSFIAGIHQCNLALVDIDVEAARQLLFEPDHLAIAWIRLSGRILRPLLTIRILDQHRVDRYRLLAIVDIN